MWVSSTYFSDLVAGVGERDPKIWSGLQGVNQGVFDCVEDHNRLPWKIPNLHWGYTDSTKCQIAGKFDGELNLVDWRSGLKPPHTNLQIFTFARNP